ncbi:PH domain protein (macronuclear) [Tetrahymena thermophila SB210]|uniref:PH domain protein n=1 Tax=Tetrahymena thermophila (strain SB210) TaxID=312017 RepID=I7LWR1_TETTS|nr:PH domain protein [Tetrahymena thermophila SB210]EAS02689.2 PH domain protein [Tetrahymena thermophila SB210]|eukprot:XP_001022934.2 PH domain protein [Tetrahymena thermophila SB210]
MVDFLKRKLMAVTGNYITINLDENKKIQIEYNEHQNQTIQDLIIQNVKEIANEQQKKKDKTDLSKQFCVLISIKDKRGVIFKRVAHKFELIKDLKEFDNAESVEFDIERYHNFYEDERKKRPLFVSQKLESNDKFLMKGQLEKRSNKDGKFKKKQVVLYKNHIQYQQGSKAKTIPFEEIKVVAPSTDQQMKNTFYLITNQRRDGHFFKAESLINMNKWISSLQQNLNYYRDMKLTTNYDEQIEKKNREVTLKIQNHTNSLLYHLEDIVKKSHMVRSLYKFIEKNLAQLNKLDKDLLFQVISINHDPQNFEQNLEYLRKYLCDQSENTFTDFLKQQKIINQFSNLSEKTIKESKSVENGMNNSDQVDNLNKSINLNSQRYIRGGGRLLSSYQTYSSFNNDTLESRLKTITKPIERLNFIFISYMNYQYKATFKFSEIISKILCNFRTENFHYKPEINLFQFHLDHQERMIPIYKDYQMQLEKSHTFKLDEKDIKPYIHNVIF